MSDNKNLIDFLVKKASNIKFTEILTEENYDKINIMDNRSFTFYLQDGNISLYFNYTGNIYAVNNCIAYNTNRQIKTFGTLNLSKKSKSRP